MTPIRVLVADDHWGFRFGMRALLTAEPDIELVGEATTGAEAVAAAVEEHPDVVLMDLAMPGGNGIEATRAILAQAPATAVLVLTMVEDDDSVFAAVRAGARGYLLKGADGVETMRAIRAVAGGEAIFGPGIARRLRWYFAAPGAARPFPELTEREREILGLVAQGLTNAAVADRLHLSHKTVRNYVSSIFTKLGVAHRGEAVARAREAGLGT
ncbi:response regulator [Pseudonocardia nigra]|uniref:response regulator n=1 Tax=Pseudonocardia nigra TaxID=1921578 RepID=UPI001C5EA56C|nr:response regulator transcription factor [Pseudonocardia nigra]